MKEATPAQPSPPSPFAGSEWFDPLEEAVRGRVRSFIEDLLEEELEAALGRERYQRGAISNGRRPRAPTAATDHHLRPADALGAAGAAGRRGGRAGMEERATAGLPAAQPPGRGADRRGLSRRHEHPPRASGAAKLFEGHIGKDVVSRAWQKTRAAWQAWQERDLAGDDIVRLILDGTVVKVRLDRKATAISLLDRAWHPARRPEGGARDQEHGGRERGRLAGRARRPDQPRARQTRSRHRRWRQRPRGGARQPLGRRPGAALHCSQGAQPACARAEASARRDQGRVQRHDARQDGRRGPGQAQRLPGALEAALSRGRRQPGKAGARLFTFLRYPPEQWRSLRTTNAIERLHEEFKRRIKTQCLLPVPRPPPCCSGRFSPRVRSPCAGSTAGQPSTVHPSTLTSPPDQPPCPRSRAAQFPPTSRHDPESRPEPFVN